MNDFHIKLSFRKKLLLSFIVLSFIPVLLIGITTYRLYNRFITDMTEKSSVETIDLICNDIDSLLNDTWQLCDALTRDIKIQENLRVKFNSVSSQYSLDLSGSMDMASLSTYRKDIFGVYVLGENGGRYKSNYYSFKPDDPRDSNGTRRLKIPLNPSGFPRMKAVLLCAAPLKTVLSLWDFLLLTRLPDGSTA